MKERTIFKSYLFLTSEEEKECKEEIAESMNEYIDEEEFKVNADDYAVFERLQTT